jgi:hypothetical protein
MEHTFDGGGYCTHVSFSIGGSTNARPHSQFGQRHIPYMSWRHSGGTGSNLPVLPHIPPAHRSQHSQLPSAPIAFASCSRLSCCTPAFAQATPTNSRTRTPYLPILPVLIAVSFHKGTGVRSFLNMVKNVVLDLLARAAHTHRLGNPREPARYRQPETSRGCQSSSHGIIILTSFLPVKSKRK